MPWKSPSAAFLHGEEARVRVAWVLEREEMRRISAAVVDEKTAHPTAVPAALSQTRAHTLSGGQVLGTHKHCSSLSKHGYSGTILSQSMPTPKLCR